MKKRPLITLAAVALLAACTSAPPAASIPTATSTTAPAVRLVGHSALYNRGMNAALAIYDHYVYVGNRTDGSSTCVAQTGLPGGTTCPHIHPGIIIVDVAKPDDPAIVGEIGRPYAGKIGITTRELRVWPQKKMLVVMSFRCSQALHACPRGTDAQYGFDLSFFDLTDPIHPKFISRYVPTSHAGLAVKPHEMFLWVDPKRPQRALMYLSTPTDSIDPTIPNLMVVDISRVTEGAPASEIAEGNWNGLFPGTHQADYPVDKKTDQCGPYDCNLFVHSMALTPDGTRAFLSMEAGQFLILNTTSIADDTATHGVLSLNDDLLTQPVNRPTWLQKPANPGAVPQTCPTNCPNGHSAVKVPGRPYVLTTDEVYGTYTSPNQGCPWGWERHIDIADPAHPKIVGEYKTSRQSLPCNMQNDARTAQFTSFSAHNPTVLHDLAVVAWHSEGLQVSDISDPAHPVLAGSYSPTPLTKVTTEDPALTRGSSKLVFWSYPIIKDGLIYVIDIRNGLYILRYSGPHADEISSVKFLEGNSNLGDAAALDR